MRTLEVFGVDPGMSTPKKEEVIVADGNHVVTGMRWRIDELGVAVLQEHLTTLGNSSGAYWHDVPAVNALGGPYMVDKSVVPLHALAISGIVVPPPRETL